jgi:hypothetical protein
MRSNTTALRVAAVAVAALSAAVAIAGWLMLAGVERVQRVGATSTSTFETLHHTVDLSVETTGTVASALSDLESLVVLVADSSDTTAAFVGEAAEVTSTRIPASLTAIENALPALIDAGAVVDDALSALSLIGVEYRPAVPLHDALRGVQLSLDGLSEDVAAQGFALHRLVPEMEEVGTTALDLAQRVDETQRQLEMAQTVLAGYGDILTETEAAIGAMSEPLQYSGFVRVLFVAIGLIGITLGVALWKIAEPPGVIGRRESWYGSRREGVGRGRQPHKE